MKPIICTEPRFPKLSMIWRIIRGKSVMYRVTVTKTSSGVVLILPNTLSSIFIENTLEV
jgi:hypothetical protein